MLPTSDNDIDGIYKYLSEHFTDKGMSSNDFHYLEILYKKAKEGK